MAYVSVLLPAFYFNTTDKEEISKALSVQFETSESSFELYGLNINDKTNFAVKFKESDLSLAAFEELIYQRDCIKAICDKTFESLQAMTTRVTEGEKEIKNYTSKKEEVNLANDNIKLKDLLLSQKELSDQFRHNTEKTLKKIKEGLKSMVCEFETIKKKSSKAKASTQRDFGLKSTDNNITNKKKRDSKGNGVPKLNFNK